MALILLVPLTSSAAASAPSVAPRAACPMAGCARDTTESLGPLMPCCCDGRSLPAAGETSATITVTPIGWAPASLSAAVASSSLPAMAASDHAVRIADHVPLYLRNASLLI